MEYGRILARAWRITWRHRALRVFELVAALNPSVYTNYANWPRGLQQWIQGVIARVELIPLTLGMLLLSLIVGIPAALVRAVGVSALIDQVNRQEDGTPPSIGAGWQAARGRAPRVFALGLLMVGVPLVVVVVVVAAPLVYAGLDVWQQAVHGFRPSIMPATAYTVTGIALCCIGLHTSVLLSLLFQLTLQSCMVDGTASGQALSAPLGCCALVPALLPSCGLSWF